MLRGLSTNRQWHQTQAQPSSEFCPHLGSTFSGVQSKLESAVVFNPGDTLESWAELLNNTPAQTPPHTHESEPLGEVAIGIFLNSLPWMVLMGCWLRTTELNNETYKEKEEMRIAKVQKKRNGQASLSHAQVHGAVFAMLHSAPCTKYKEHDKVEEYKNNCCWWSPEERGKFF